MAAYEILISNSAVANLIREKKTFQISSIMQTGNAQGMTTLNDGLRALVKNRVIDVAEAYRNAVHKAEFARLLSREGFQTEFSES